MPRTVVSLQEPAADQVTDDEPAEHEKNQRLASLKRCLDYRPLRCARGYGAPTGLRVRGSSGSVDDAQAVTHACQSDPSIARHEKTSVPPSLATNAQPP